MYIQIKSKHVRTGGGNIPGYFEGCVLDLQI